MSKKIILITQYFEYENKSRQTEINNCLKINCNNPFIDKIILLNEKIFNLEIMNHSKISQVDISKRLTYNDVFKYSYLNCNKHDIKILANTDIILSYNDLKYLKKCNLDNKVFALLRFELVPPQNKINKEFLYEDIKDNWIHEIYNCQTSQDVWIYNHIDPDEKYDFNLGIRGCDNHIAYLLDKNNYNVTNPSHSIKVFHLHNNSPKSQQCNLRRKYRPFPKWEYKFIPSVKNNEIEIQKNQDKNK